MKYLHHNRNRLQSWLHTKPNTPHSLFSHHTRCSPTPSSMMMPISIHPTPFPLTVVICASDCTDQEWHTCMLLKGSAAACQSGDREPLGVPGAAARTGVLQLDSAARILPVSQLCLERGRRSSANIYAPTHTLSHRTNMYSSTVTHLHTQWHVNRHSQYTPEITPNSETVKLKFSCTLESDSLFFGFIRNTHKLKQNMRCSTRHTFVLPSETLESLKFNQNSKHKL